MSANYSTSIQRFRSQKVVVIGEMMLDVYLSGTSNRICREAPVPIVNIIGREDMPGGAANTAANVAAMGGSVKFLTVTGDDAEARIVTSLLEACGVDMSGIVRDAARQTLTKQRVLSDGQLLVRYDYGTTDGLTAACEQQLIERLVEAYGEAEAVLVSDYGYGILSDAVLDALKDLERQHPKLLVVDSKYLAKYQSLQPTAVKPNYGESLELLGLEQAAKGKRVDQMLKHGHEILAITGASIAALTIDSEGAVIFERGRTPYRTYAKAAPDSKAAGAGDTYVSALTLALAAGCSALQAAEIAAAAATVVVHKDGTARCTADELAQYFAPPQKIITSREELAERVQAYREQGRRVVFTNGCYDILHRGHIHYLGQAKALGDILIVGVNDDDSVRRLKGAERPINPLDDRMQVLAALDTVDYVVSFGEDTSVELIKIVKPDVFVKGGDRDKASLPEAPIVESLGGVVEIVPYVAELSTTAVIQKIRATGDDLPPAANQ